MNRRHFLQLTGGCAVSASVSGNLYAVRPAAERIRIGAQTNTWGAPIKSYDELLRICDSLVKLGYAGFETNYRSLESQAANAARCRKDFESRRIQFIAPHCGVTLFDSSKQTAEIDKLTGIGNYSAEMGATHFIASGVALPRVNGKLDHHAASIKAAGLNKLGEVCRKTGLTLCYHNERWEFQDQPSEMSILLKETDPKLVSLAYDVANAFGMGPDAADFSASNFRRIAIYHIKDAIPTPKGRVVDVDLGAGKVNLRGVVAPLLNSDWEGWLTVEREGPFPNPSGAPEKLQRQCREYLKQITGL